MMEQSLPNDMLIYLVLYLVALNAGYTRKGRTSLP